MVKMPSGDLQLLPNSHLQKVVKSSNKNISVKKGQVLTKKNAQNKIRSALPKKL
jgi:hypothetical protein